MAANVPIIKQISWLALIPQLLFIGLVFYLYQWAGFQEPFLLAAITYYILAILLRNIIAKYHRQGIRLVKRLNFAEAIFYFEKSVDYFTKNNWVDKYRSLTLLSSSNMSYKAMGLCNIAFSYSQLGNGPKAKEYYELALQESPENGLAIAGLNMLKSMENKTQSPSSIE